jgi:hypothetical protein
MLLMLAKALGFTWGNTLSLLFLGARNHRINAHDLNGMKNDYQRLNVMTSRSVLKFYQSRRNIGKVLTEAERQLALSVHSV